MYCSKCGAAIADGAAFCPACGQPTGSPATTGTGSARFAYAGFWLRFVAYIIDAIILGFVLSIAVFLPLVGSSLRTFSGSFPDMMRELRPEFQIARLISLLGGWVYYALLESSAWQATLGKKALGLEVVDLNGRRISFGRATGRYFAKILSAIILLIGFIMIGFTEKKQGLHDMVAGCLVVKKI
jgi:uncharacterized RDD family membrane protein YckC